MMGKGAGGGPQASFLHHLFTVCSSYTCQSVEYKATQSSDMKPVKWKDN